ncbi:uncharacterized protein LOC128217721 isoform X2 [Mya arenaria]|uniref:uncharacterized protein LOC128217721 isoform X2 n=1 Tax=Mya arenaria TaxID=6604 RepID=UPI0022E8EC06|nr:uncharacterized protein LOC128217721 isoform X2 [Mya arenaria]
MANVMFIWILLISGFCFRGVSAQCGGTLMATIEESRASGSGSCGWTVTVSAEGTQAVVYLTLLVTDPGCKDYVAVYDSTTANDSSLIGSKQCQDDISQYVFTSTGSVLFVVTSGVVGQIEFLYFAADTTEQPLCTVRTEVTQLSRLMSPSLPNTYTSNDSCAWTFWSESGITFTVMMTDFSCPNDYLEIYDGLHRSSPVLISRSDDGSNSTTFPIHTSGYFARVVFWASSDTDCSTNNYGFLLTYEVGTVDIAPNRTEGCNTTGVYLDTPEMQYYAYITIGDGTYDNFLNCTWFITAPENHAVMVEFADTKAYGIEFNSFCRYDSLTLYDGSNTSVRMNKFCGYVMPPHRYQSTGSDMTIVFLSDYIVGSSGFTLRYYVIDIESPYCREDYPSYESTYNLQADYIAINSTWKLNIDYPSTWRYPKNAEVFWLITIEDPSLYRLVMSFKYSRIESSVGCTVDWFILYNGPCRTDDILDRTCGHYGYWLKTYNIEGTESAYLLYFHSDNSFNYRGFILQYYAELRSVEAVATTTPVPTFGPPVDAVIEAINGSLFGYVKDVMPSRDTSAAIEALINFYLVGVNGLDEVEQKLTSTLQLEVEWTDISLAWDPEKRDGIVRMLLPQNDIWKPDITLMNGFKKITAMGDSFMYVDVNYNGTCLWKPYQIVETTCQVDMTNFPYDSQTCYLQFGTWSSSDEISTEFGEDGLQRHHNFQDHAEWKVILLGVDTSTNNTGGAVRFHVTIERNSRFITFYVTIPTVMLAFLTVFRYIIPVESGEKSGFSISVFLSFVVVLIVVNDTMPDNSDNISLYAAYSLTMAIVSALSTAFTVMQIRAATLETKRYSIPRKIQALVRLVLQNRDKVINILSQLPKELEQENVEEMSVEEIKDTESEDDTRVPIEHLFPKYDCMYLERGATALGIERMVTAASIRFDWDTKKDDKFYPDDDKESISSKISMESEESLSKYYVNDSTCNSDETNTSEEELENIDDLKKHNESNDINEHVTESLIEADNIDDNIDKITRPIDIQNEWNGVVEDETDINENPNAPDDQLNAEQANGSQVRVISVTSCKNNENNIIENENDEEIVREVLNSSPIGERIDFVASRPTSRSVSFFNHRVRPISPNRTISAQESRPSSRGNRPLSRTSRGRNILRSAFRKRNSVDVTDGSYTSMRVTFRTDSGHEHETLCDDSKGGKSKEPNDSIFVGRPPSAISEAWCISDTITDEPFPTEDLAGHSFDDNGRAISGKSEDDEKPIEWRHVVECSDIIVFVVLMIITLLFTLAMFLSMITG